MTASRVTEMICDACGHTENWYNATEARANLWRKDGDDDLCPSCAKNTPPPRCAWCEGVILRGHGKQPIYCHERCRWSAVQHRRREREAQDKVPR